MSGAKDNLGPRDEAFLSRWSRRKRAQPADKKRAVPPKSSLPNSPQEALPDATFTADPARSDAEVLAELGLKDPDLLEKGDIFSAYLQEAVPTRLRNRALRKLWLSDPALANLDDLLEYGEDFTGKGVGLETVTTVFKAGRDMAARLSQKDQAEHTAVPPLPTDPVASEEELPEIEAALPPEAQPSPSDLVPDVAPDDVPAPAARYRPRQRMTFRF